MFVKNLERVLRLIARISTIISNCDDCYVNREKNDSSLRQICKNNRYLRDFEIDSNLDYDLAADCE